MKSKKKRLPRVYYFNKKVHKDDYIIIDENGTIHVPRQYFRYLGEIWPIYKDETHHQECIYFLHEFIGAGEFNFDYVNFFVRYLDRCLIKKTKKFNIKTKKTK